MFRKDPPETLAASDRARRVVRLSHQSRRFRSGTRPRSAAADRRVPVRRRVRLHLDETNYMADVLLPERTDIESTQLIRIGSTKFIEQFWDHEGFALRQPAVGRAATRRDFTDIATELAARAGLLEPLQRGDQPRRGRRGVGRTRLRSSGSTRRRGTARRKSGIASAARRARAHRRGGRATASIGTASTATAPSRFRGSALVSLPGAAKQGLRFEMPYQERLARTARSSGTGCTSAAIEWWDGQLAEYQALPAYKDFPGIWERHTVAQRRAARRTIRSGCVTSRSMQYAWGANVGIPLMDEVARKPPRPRRRGDQPRGRAGSASPTATPSRCARRWATRAAPPCCARAYGPTRC